MDKDVTPGVKFTQEQMEQANSVWNDPQKILQLLDIMFLYKEDTLPS